MTALFDEPLRVTLRPDRYPIETDQVVGMLLGFTLKQEGKGSILLAIVCLADGRIATLPPAAYTVDWRYKVDIDRWIDTNAPNPDGEDDQEP